MIKLSRCTCKEQIFLYQGVLVNMQLLLKEIFNNQLQGDVYFVHMDAAFHDVVNKATSMVSYNAKNEIEREHESLSGLHLQKVMIDIKPEHIKKEENGYAYVIPIKKDNYD